MMIEKIKADQLQARKDKDKQKTAILTYVLGLISQKQNPVDGDVVVILTQNIKAMEKSIDDNPSTKDVLQPDIDVLRSYLPEEITVHDVIRIVRPLMTVGEKDIGKLMKEVKDACSVSGKLFNGKIVQQTIKDLSKG